MFSSESSKIVNKINWLNKYGNLFIFYAKLILQDTEFLIYLKNADDPRGALNLFIVTVLI